MAGFLGVVAFGAYNYKNRGTMATSMYLMQLRVAAQGTVVGILSLGLIYQIYNRIERLRHRDASIEPSTPSALKKGKRNCNKLMLLPNNLVETKFNISFLFILYRFAALMVYDREARSIYCV